jgi:hypothetical protein
MKVVARSLTLVYCTWIDYDGTAQSGTFETDALRPEAELAAEGLAAASAAMLEPPPAAVPMQMAEPEQPPDASPPEGSEPAEPGAAS